MTTLMGGVGYGAKWLVFQLGVTLDEVLAAAAELKDITVEVVAGIQTLKIDY